MFCVYKMAMSSTPNQIVFALLLLIKIHQIGSSAVPIEVKNTNLNIAVIGAGVTGLVSARHAIDQGHNVIVYEQSEEIGGLWVYTDRTGTNEYGVNIHTAMYTGLR